MYDQPNMASAREYARHLLSNSEDVNMVEENTVLSTDTYIPYTDDYVMDNAIVHDNLLHGQQTVGDYTVHPTPAAHGYASAAHVFNPNARQKNCFFTALGGLVGLSSKSLGQFLHVPEEWIDFRGTPYECKWPVNSTQILAVIYLSAVISRCC